MAIKDNGENKDNSFLRGIDHQERYIFFLSFIPNGEFVQYS
jgi:hypothetical protein